MLGQLLSELLGSSRRILLAGAGGGYDVLGAIPLWHELILLGKEVYFASLSFCRLNELEGAVRHAELSNLYAVESAAADRNSYCPEAWLASWLENLTGKPHPIWCFERTGVLPLARAYQFLVNELNLDAIILLDGGIDSILKGDEYSIGTPEEDLVSLAAVESIDVGVKLLVCLGFGAEIRDGISHSQAFERIAELTGAGGYFGAAALIGASTACKRYVEAVEYVFANQARQRKSHIQATVLEAIRGRFGSLGPFIWYSPLLSLYWVFSLPVVAQTHLFLKDLRETENIEDVSLIIEGNRHELEIKPRSSIPI